MLPKGSFFEQVNKKVECKKCNWKGMRSDCRKEYYSSDKFSWMMLSGREGFHYHCPKCDEVIDRDYYMFS
jgi:predicted RNA-binding Zn-ribbon protein involved in translation (DUF1610 family)